MIIQYGGLCLLSSHIDFFGWTLGNLTRDTRQFFQEKLGNRVLYEKGFQCMKMVEYKRILLQERVGERGFCGTEQGFNFC